MSMAFRAACCRTSTRITWLSALPLGAGGACARWKWQVTPTMDFGTSLQFSMLSSSSKTGATKSSTPSSHASPCTSFFFDRPRPRALVCGGDREGQILIRQITTITAEPFAHLGIWSATGTTWLGDIIWSMTNGSQVVSCASGNCDLATAYIPADRSSHCPAGTTWKNDLGCDACPLGRFSAGGIDECQPCGLGSFSNASGLAQCYVCPPGTVGKAQGAEECNICNEGFFMNESGSSECLKCYEGTFADESGLTQCRDCPAGRTTNFQGALDAQACTCNGDLWEGQCLRCQDSTRFERGACVLCQEGLVCEEGEAPVILPGYYATPEAPYDVYKCLPADKCPGGAQGACTGGRVGVPCTHCPDGQSFEDGLCTPCGNLSTAGWVAAMLFGMVFLVVGYYLMNTAATAKVSMMPV